MRDTTNDPQPAAPGARQQAEEALRVSEERYSTLLNSIDKGFCVIEVFFDQDDRPLDYRFLEVNRVFEQQTGLANAAGRTARELVPGLETHWFESYGKVAQTGEPTRFVDGSDVMGRWFDVYAFRIGKPREHKVGVLFSDITARKAAEQALKDRERLLEILLKVSDAARQLHDEVDIAREACRLVKQETGAISCSYGFVYPEDDRVLIVADVCDADKGVPCLEGEWSLSGFGPELIALHEQGDPVVIEDTAVHPATAASQAVFDAIHTRSLIGIPLVRDGRFMAYLSIHDQVPRRYTEAEISLLRDVAVRIWEAVQRSRAEAALQANEAQFRTLTAAIPQLIWTARSDGRLDYLSEQWVGYTGIQPEQLYGSTWDQMVHPDDLPEARRVWAASIETGEPLESRQRVRHRSGGWRWQLVRGLPLKDEHGHLTRWIGTCTDIDDQQVAAQDALFLDEIAEQIRIAGDPDSLSHTIVWRLGQYLRATRCYIAEMDAPNDRWFVQHEFHVAPPAIAGDYRISDYPADLVRVMRDGQVLVAEDTQTDPRSAAYFQAAYAPIGVRAHIVVPFLHAGEWVWNLVVATDTPRQWQDREVRLLQTVAERAWNAVEQLRAWKALRESQATLALSLQAGQAGTFMWDIQRDVNIWSPELEALYGLPPGGFAGSYQAWASRVEPDDVRRVEAGLQAALQARQRDYAYEFRVVLPDGARRWFAGRARFDYDPAGAPLRMLGINVDIHERKQVELNAQFLLDLDARLNQLVEADAIEQVVVDSLGAYLDVTRCYFGHVDDERVAVRFEWRCDGPSALGVYRLRDYFSPQAVTQLAMNITTVVDDVTSDPRTAGEAANHLALAVGAFITVPVIHQGRWVGAFNIVSPRQRGWRVDEVQLLRDVVARVWPLLEQAQARAALRESKARLQLLYAQEQAARAQAEEASRLKDEFLATVSHELRTPLTAFLGYAELLLRRKHDEAYVVRTVEKMVRSARAQARLVEDLLDVSRIVSGNLRIDPQPMYLEPVVRAALDTVRPAVEAKNIDLDVELNDDGPIVGDASRLQQVVWNLLSNATKFTPAGGQIQVRLERHERDVQLIVSDTGQGISADFLPYVFDRFRQADGTSNRAHGGLGLGLAIVRHLIELHGGTVQAGSQGQGHGATFTVRLPQASDEVLAAAGPLAPY